MVTVSSWQDQGCLREHLVLRYIGYMRGSLEGRGSVCRRAEVAQKVQKGDHPLIWGRLFAMGSEGRWEQGYAPAPFFATP